MRHKLKFIQESTLELVNLAFDEFVKEMECNHTDFHIINMVYGGVINHKHTLMLAYSTYNPNNWQ